MSRSKKTATTSIPIKNQVRSFTTEEILDRAILLIRKRSRLIIRDEVLLRGYLTSKLDNIAEPDSMTTYELLCVNALINARDPEEEDLL